MHAIFATLCLVGAPEICREAMLPQPQIGPAVCARAEALAEDWVAARPDFVLDGVSCREAGAGLTFEEVAPGVFAHIGPIALPGPGNLAGISNLGFIVGEASVAVFDSGGSRAVGEAALRGLRQITDLPISHVFLGHMHPDHVFGARVFEEAGGVIYGHENLTEALAARQANYAESLLRLVGADGFLGTEAPQVSQGISGEMEIDLGGRSVWVRSFSTAHTNTDIVLMDLQSRTLFSSDLVFLTHTPALDGSLRGWQAVMDELAAMDIARVVPGHGPVRPFPSALEPTRNYLSVLAKGTEAALEEGLSMSEATPEIAQSERGNWALFDEFNIRNATSAYAEIEWE